MVSITHAEPSRMTSRDLSHLKRSSSTRKKFQKCRRGAKLRRKKFESSLYIELEKIESKYSWMPPPLSSSLCQEFIFSLPAFYFSNSWKQQCFRRRLAPASVLFGIDVRIKNLRPLKFLAVCSTSLCVEGIFYHWNANIFRRQASAWSCWQTNLSIDSDGILAKGNNDARKEKSDEKWQSSTRWKRFHLSLLQCLTVDSIFKVQFDF